MGADEQDKAKKLAAEKAAAEERAAKLAARNRVIKEIKTSEESYLAQLEVLNNFIKTLTDAADPKSLEGRFASSPEGQKFLNAIRPLTTITMLSKELYRELPDPTAPQEHQLDQLNTTFLKYATYFKSYSTYVSANVTILCDELRKNNKDFQKLEAQFQADPKANGQSLLSYLIVPVQRVPRYVLLLKEVQKQENGLNSKPNERLAAITTQIAGIGTAINDAVRKQETATTWTTEFSKQPKNRSREVTTIEREGNLSHAFQKNSDLLALQMKLNNELTEKFGRQDVFIRVECTFKKPLVINCVSATKPPVTLYKITQNKDGQHFNVEITNLEFAVKGRESMVVDMAINKADYIREAIGTTVAKIAEAGKAAAEAAKKNKNTNVAQPGSVVAKQNPAVVVPLEPVVVPSPKEVPAAKVVPRAPDRDAPKRKVVPAAKVVPRAPNRVAPKRKVVPAAPSRPAPMHLRTPAVEDPNEKPIVIPPPKSVQLAQARLQAAEQTLTNLMSKPGKAAERLTHEQILQQRAGQKTRPEIAKPAKKQTELLEWQRKALEIKKRAAATRGGEQPNPNNSLKPR